MSLLVYGVLMGCCAVIGVIGVIGILVKSNNRLSKLLESTNVLLEGRISFERDILDKIVENYTKGD